MAVLEVARRSTPGRIWSSTIGKKAVMGVTGLAMLLFVIAHMVGNLKIFLGRESIDHYAVWLREILGGLLGNEGLLWVLRLGLVACVALHMTAAIQLARRARRARPAGYQHRRRIQGSYAARTMRWGGVILALFIVYHILDLTAGVLNPNGVHMAVYDNMVADFKLWYVVLFYSAAVIALGFHIRHGMWSAMQSLGASSAARQKAVQSFSFGVALVITLGYLSVPFAVLTGLVG
ncbi:succinate dehydrogenase / fumarate reductase cytochrome b subunit [Kibdelosporangium banguiense]|uniref:Succinate dehydrogenase / fumarate reductase cytochrome b subunit n=1 Tax=Kibdelosporangium banguiense TaxID=1365924 RepID=A0ABS4TGQ5_9PSEU|nr:succinate dehydrogenase cytochrome b subunit [Kibdelosporangium banguiense]MBP2323597.1 succinate dehydrogenase / fumarate reductase cytochrome b subunit [Kibdelosporangium banguiense]